MYVYRPFASICVTSLCLDPIKCDIIIAIKAFFLLNTPSMIATTLVSIMSTFEIVSKFLNLNF